MVLQRRVKLIAPLQCQMMTSSRWPLEGWMLRRYVLLLATWCTPPNRHTFKGNWNCQEISCWARNWERYWKTKESQRSNNTNMTLCVLFYCELVDSLVWTLLVDIYVAPHLMLFLNLSIMRWGLESGKQITSFESACVILKQVKVLTVTSQHWRLILFSLILQY